MHETHFVPDQIFVLSFGEKVKVRLKNKVYSLCLCVCVKVVY